MKSLNPQGGFTLIEMIVVIGIVVIVPVIVVANFSQIRLQFALSRASHQFAAEVRRAQEMANSTVPYEDDFGQQQIPAGYGIYLGDASLGNKKYIVYADAAPGNEYYDSLDHVVATVNLSDSEPGIFMKGFSYIAGSGMSINFSSSHQGAVITVSREKKADAEVVFAVESNETKQAGIFINSLGLIDVR